ncbi:MAG: type II secretion system F family protein [Candidatus Nanoarchaeia archaeon]
MKQRVPFIYFPEIRAKQVSKKLSIISRLVNSFFPTLEDDLRTADMGTDKDTYSVLVTLNALCWMLFSGIFLFALIVGLDARPIIEAIYYSVGLGLFLFLLIAVVTIRYPKVVAGKNAEKIESNLIFALKDLLLKVSAGTQLYDALVSIANSDYGEVSKEFEKVAKQVQSGRPLEAALEEMALRTSSEYMKRTVWQIVNVLKSGSNLKTALRIVITEQLQNHKEKIRNYAQELNLWSLIYMLFAVAIPTIGLTLMLILTTFSGFGLTRGLFIVFGVLCLLVQYVIIGLIHSRRPAINF